LVIALASHVCPGADFKGMLDVYARFMAIDQAYREMLKEIEFKYDVSTSG